MRIKPAFGKDSSPALDRHRLFAQWDHEGDSFTVAVRRCTPRASSSSPAASVAHPRPRRPRCRRCRYRILIAGSPRS